MRERWARLAGAAILTGAVGCAHAQIELPAMKVVRIRTTVWVPANSGEPMLIGARTVVGEEPRSGWRWVAAGPHRKVPVYFSETAEPAEQVDERALVGGVDPFLLPDLQRLRAEQKARDQSPERVLSPLEFARRAMKTGDLPGALAKYRLHLEGAPRDAEALRELGLAHLLGEKPLEAAKIFERAYADDPSLVEHPLLAELFKDEKAELTRRTENALALARRKHTPGLWLVALALSQTDRRDKTLAKLVEQARHDGLSEELCARFLKTLELPKVEPKPGPESPREQPAEVPAKDPATEHGK